MRSSSSHSRVAKKLSAIALSKHSPTEQLKSGLDACDGEGNAKGRAHYEKLHHLLRHELDGVEKVIRSLNHERRKHPENKRIAEGVQV